MDNSDLESGPAAALTLEEVSHGYRDFSVLNGASLALQAGELAALTAPSGAGKSTLLHIAGLLERPKAGRVFIGKDCGWDQAISDSPKINQSPRNPSGKFSGSQSRTELRRHALGFVFQFHYLLPEFTALENIVLSLRLAGMSKKEARMRADSLLERVGLQKRAGHLPAELSGGEQQRIAVARALANQPKLLLADEPTGNLDPDTAQSVFALLLELTREQGAAALVVTHAEALADKCDRRFYLKQGQIHPA